MFSVVFLFVFCFLVFAHLVVRLKKTKGETLLLLDIIQFCVSLAGRPGQTFQIELCKGALAEQVCLLGQARLAPRPSAVCIISSFLGSL